MKHKEKDRFEYSNRFTGDAARTVLLSFRSTPDVP